MKVRLLPIDEDKVINKIYTACRTCYSAESPVDIYTDEVALNKHTKEQKLKLINYVLSSGHYSTVEHVQLTFAVEGVSRACYDNQTEVLTTSGWKLFKDLTPDDLVGTRSSSGSLEFQKPTSYINYFYDGVMHQYKSENVNLCVTPNHNMFIKKYDVRVPQDYQLVPSDKIHLKRIKMTKDISWNPQVSDVVQVPGYTYSRRSKTGVYDKTLPDFTADKEVFTKFLAMYLSEGSVTYNEKENSYTIIISQLGTSISGHPINQETRQEVIHVFRQLGLTPGIGKSCIKTKQLVLGKFLKGLGNSGDKKFPFSIFEYFDTHYAQVFIDTYCKYDGNIYKGHRRLYTTSPQLRDDLQLIAGIAGYASSIHVDDRVGQYHQCCGNTIRHNRVCYSISLSNLRNINPMIKPHHVTKTPYCGQVYCVEVPNHVVLVRRGYLICWCGNCTHQLVRHRHASYSQQSQRYVEFKDGGFDYVTPKSIEKNEKASTIFDEAMAYLTNSYANLTELGIPAEDARAVLPNACCTNITMSMNIRELIHICNERLCTCAQDEIRTMVREMVKEVNITLPFLKDYLVPKCEMLGYCNEPRRSCGRKKLKSEVIQ